jgi:hypothetical protein
MSLALPTAAELGVGALLTIYLTDRILNWTIRWKREGDSHIRQQRAYCSEQPKVLEAIFTVEKNADTLKRLDSAMLEQAKSQIKQVLLLERMVELAEKHEECLAELIAVVKRNGNKL